MSYNPAFVADESPLAHTNSSDHDQSNGIKLISFKVLPKSSITNNQQPPLKQLKNQSHQTLQHHLEQANSQDVVLDIRNEKQQDEYNPTNTRRYPSNGATSNKQQNKVSSSNNNQYKSQSKSGAAKQQSHQKAAQMKVSSSNQVQQQQQLQSAKINNNSSKPAKTNANLCMSTSSSLSLIDNPTLGSLTPSASSYSTTSSSILSSSGLCAAVECRDMRYDVGRGRNQKTILYNINVTVPEGSIYGLLGPSGCGKTTMLRCVVGRIKPKEGYVRVFGYRPNDSGSQIPGPAIGYMPQVSVSNQSIVEADTTLCASIRDLNSQFKITSIQSD